jgi:predicted aconitase
MEISEKQEITVKTTHSMEVSGFVIYLQITKENEQAKYVSLGRTAGERAPDLIPNVLHLYSMEEAEAALELLKAGVGNGCNE